MYPLHSSVTLEEQNNVFLSPVPGYRKVGAGGRGGHCTLCWGVGLRQFSHRRVPGEPACASRLLLVSLPGCHFLCQVSERRPPGVPGTARATSVSALLAPFVAACA